MKPYVLIVFLAVSVWISAANAHYVECHASAGVGSLGYELNGGSTFLAPSFSAGAGYTWFFLPSAGFQTGILFTSLSTTAVLIEPMKWTTWQDGRRLTDYMDEEYTHIASFTDWREEQQIWLLQVPIGMRFRFFPAVSYGNAAESRLWLHVAAGALLTLPVRSHYTHTSGEITHTGWYPQWNLLLHDIPGRFETEPYTRLQESFTSHLRSFSVALYAEAGVLWRLGERTELSVAAYAQWMPQNFSQPTSGPDAQLGFANESNRYTFMNEYHGLIGTDKAGAMHPWSVGLKASVAIWTGRTKMQKKRCLCAGIK